MGYPEDLRYTSEHEWARLESGLVTVGITSYATEQLGDIVFVELPQVGKRIEAMKAFGTIEAVKTASDLYAPIGGEVVAINEALADNPALVNQSPFGEGWMIRLKPANSDDVKRLMNHEAYEQLIEEQHA